MRLSVTSGVDLVLAFILLIVVYGSLFTVDQRHQALVVRLGQPLPPITEPGLH